MPSRSHLIVGARAFWGPNKNFGPILIDNIHCDSHEKALLDCDSRRSWFYCRHGGGASVRCREEQL